jgi:hypothetical protein
VDRLSLAKIDPEGKPWGQLMTAFAIVIRRIDGLTAPNSEQDFTPNKNQADKSCRLDRPFPSLFSQESRYGYRSQLSQLIRRVS